MNNLIKRALLFDANAMMYRAYFGISRDATHDQSRKIEDTLLTIKRKVLELLKQHPYEYAVAVFDSSKITFRTQKLKEYKAQRPPMPEDLFHAIPEVWKIFKNIGIRVVCAPKLFEGDDVLGTIANQLNKLEVVVDVISTDRDLLQLVNHLTSVHLLKKGASQSYNHNNFEILNDGLLPYQIPIYKAISGDSSDNYKGIPTLGERKALSLIVEYKNKENIYKNLDKLSPKIKDVLIEHEKDLNLYIEIATIVKDVEIPHSIEDYKIIRREE